MKTHSIIRHHRSRLRRGFSLLEVAISVLMIGLLMTGALVAAGAAKAREMSSSDKVRGKQLAADLVNEILRQAYQDPRPNPLFGPEPGEVTGNRSLFNDVDDYLGWTGTPPTDKNGNPLTGFQGWTRSVNVAWADPTTLAATSSTYTNLKRITVTVTSSGQTEAQLVAYRSIAWVDTMPTPTDATGNHPPVAAATGQHLSGKKNTTATFSASGSSDQDGDYLSYVWQFGDGGDATGVSASHLYNVVGSYTCTLTVYDGRGGVATSSLTVTVTP